MSVLPAHTKKAKELDDNSPNKSDEIDAALISRLTGEGRFVPFPFLSEDLARSPAFFFSSCAGRGPKIRIAHEAHG